MKQKLVGTLEDPKCKHKKVSGTIFILRFLLHCFSSAVRTIGHWVTGIPSASTERSVEQKQQNNKIVGTLRHWVTCKCKKISGKKWWGPLRIPSASAKRSAEQFLFHCFCSTDGTIGHWVMGTLSTNAKRSAEQKQQNKTSRSKTVEQKRRNKNW